MDRSCDRERSRTRPADRASSRPTFSLLDLVVGADSASVGLAGLPVPTAALARSAAGGQADPVGLESLLPAGSLDLGTFAQIADFAGAVGDPAGTPTSPAVTNVPVLAATGLTAAVPALVRPVRRVRRASGS